MMTTSDDNKKITTEAGYECSEAAIKRFPDDGNPFTPFARLEFDAKNAPTPHVEGEREHSPLPWAVGRGERIEAANGRIVADMTHDSHGLGRPQANAQFIVRAVNSHQALVEALREVIAWLDESDQSKTKAGGVGVFAYEGTEYQVVTRARAALQAAADDKEGV